VSGASVPGEGQDGLVTVARFSDPMAAELARSRLEADGLTCFLVGSGFGSLLPTATMYPILLQVPAGEVSRAREILEEPPEAPEPGSA